MSAGISVTMHIDVTAAIAHFGDIEKNSIDAIHNAVEKSTIDVRDLWRENATITAGKHGKLYPKSIQYEMKSGFNHITGEIMPKGGPQSDMSFELGSRNQPPHLDGQRAFDTWRPEIQRRINRAVWTG